MSYISQTEQAIQKVELGRVLADSKLIKGIIKRDRGSSVKKDMANGAKYYTGQHDVLNKDFRKYHFKGKQLINENKANNKVVNAFHTDLVDQKAEYILSKQPIITSSKAEVKRNIEQILNAQFYDLLYLACVGTSNKGLEWGHVFINENGDFDFVITPAEQIIPDYDTNYKTKLLSVMRYYFVDSQDERGNLKQRTKVEIWDEKEVWFYIEDKEGEFVLDMNEKENPRPHWKELLKQGESIVETDKKSWGKPPFVPLPNNINQISDLKRIKTLIDLYDIITSNFGNDVEDRREMVIVIKNYGGQDNEELVQMLKESGVIKVSSDGGAEALTLTIPVEAKNSILKLLRENIYRFGRGFDLSDENFAGTITGIALKYKYAGLDLKANALIKKMKKFIQELLSFWALYNNFELNENEIEITFNKTIIINETEAITNVVASNGIISEETALANHPWVNDVEAELGRKKKEKEGIVDVNTVTV